MENRKKIVDANTEKYIMLIRTLDPEIYEIKISLLETGINPEVILHLIRSLAIVANGTGFGEISVQLRDGKIGIIKSTETVIVEQDILSKRK